jgi:signal recognition particle subunit SEC65
MKNFVKKLGKVVSEKINSILEFILIKRIKLKKIIKYLKKIGWDYKILQEQIKDYPVWNIYYHGYYARSYNSLKDYTVERICSKIKGMHSIFNLNIMLHQEFVEFAIFDYIKGLESAGNKDEIFKLLLRYNAKIDNFGGFGYNSNTDYITFRLIYPSLRSNITFPQFWQCLMNFLTTADQVYPQIMEKLQKGKEEDNEGE